MIGCICLLGELADIIRRLRQDNEMTGTLPHFSRIACQRLRRIAHHFRTGGTKVYCFLTETFLDILVNLIQLLNMVVIIYQRRIKVGLSHLILLQDQIDVVLTGIFSAFCRIDICGKTLRYIIVV